MRHALIAFALIAAAETAAIACSCMMAPQSAAERQRLVREVSRRAVALVEVEVVSPYDERTGRGERLRVRRTFAGRAPALVTIERLRQPSGASCDVQFMPRQRATVILYPAARPTGPGVYSLSSTCTTYMLADQPFRAALIAEMRRRR